VLEDGEEGAGSGVVEIQQNQLMAVWGSPLPVMESCFQRDGDLEESGEWSWNLQ